MGSTTTLFVGTKSSNKERRQKVKIKVNQNNSILFLFDPNEIPVAVAILKGIYRSTGFEWVQRAILDIERFTSPKQIPFTLSTRICEKCFCEVDIKTNNAIHYTGEQDKWQHRNCPLLKDNRPV